MHNFTEQEQTDTIEALNATKTRELIQFKYPKDTHPSWKDYNYDSGGLKPLEIVSSGGLLRVRKTIQRPITWKELDFSKCIWVARAGYVPRLVVGTDITSGNGGRLIVITLSNLDGQAGKAEDLYLNTLAQSDWYYSHTNATYLGNSLGLVKSFQPPQDGSWKPFMVTEVAK